MFAAKFIPSSPNDETVVIDCSEISEGLLTYYTFSDNGINVDETEGSVIIGNCVTSLDESIFDTAMLTSISLPNSLISIGASAFAACHITSITIPSSVTTIDDYAFENCWLTSATCEAAIPPSLGEGAFDATHNCPIYVPAASVSAYQSASGWSTYASRIQAIQTT